MFASTYPYPKVDSFPASYKSKFVDYTAHQPRLATSSSMGELHFAAQNCPNQQDSLQRTAISTSPLTKTSRMTDSPSGSESMDSSSVIEHCHTSTRKRRRGVIEKRRRDRINNSLAELRRLVPSAFEKQGSTKLEKAEILQMTVDHLKSIHTKGINYASNGIDPHLLGFQECAAEIQRFIVQDEQFSAQDQLRSRLLSHLQCYTAQRETFKPSHTAWHSPGHYPTGPTGLVPPPPPVGLSGSSLLNGCSPADSMSGNGLAPSCLGTSYGAATPTSSFSPSPSQYPAAFQATNHMQSMYTSQANYASARTYRPWAGHELVY